MKKPKPSAIGDIIENLRKTSKLGAALEQAQIWERWEEITGPYLSKHGRPYAVKDGQLRISVDSAVWMHKFSYRKWEIIKQANRIAGKELIHDIFLLLTDDEEAARPTE